jgi:hypothetical protein
LPARKIELESRAVAGRVHAVVSVFIMRNQDAPALGCMWLLGSGIISILVPALLLAIPVESKAVWYSLAPGCELSPFGHADLPEMFLALSINAIFYAAVTGGILYLIVRVARREEYS